MASQRPGQLTIRTGGDTTSCSDYSNGSGNDELRGRISMPTPAIQPGQMGGLSRGAGRALGAEEVATRVDSVADRVAHASALRHHSNPHLRPHRVDCRCQRVKTPKSQKHFTLLDRRTSPSDPETEPGQLARRPIGVSRYVDPEIGDIPAAANNIEDLKELLTAPVGAAFRGEDCITIVNPDSPQQVGKVLANVTSQANDVLLVYYAGHGLVDQRGRLYLAVTGSDSAHPEWSSIPFATLRENLVAARARAHFILDCCFSGRAFRP